MKSNSVRIMYHNMIRMSDSALIGSRFTLALAELLTGIILLLAGNSFLHPSYEAMSNIFDEDTWGLIFLTTGIIQSYLLLTYNFNSKTSIVFAGFNAYLWLYVVMSILTSYYPPTAEVASSAALAVSASWVFIKSGFCRSHVKPCERSVGVKRCGRIQE